MRQLPAILSILLCFSPAGKAQEVDLQTWVNQKQYADVIRYAANLSAADSASYATMNAIAQACEGLLDYREAFGYYLHCLQMDTTDAGILTALARTATNLGKAPEAEYYFQKVLAADSTNFYANYQLARLYFQLGDYEGALEKYDYLLEQHEENPTLLRNRGDCYMRLENPPAAISSYFEAYRLNRENAGLAGTLINAMLRMGGDWAAGALAVCDTALSYNPGNRLLEQNKGMALYFNKKYAEADTLYAALMAKGDSSYLTLKYGGASRYYAGQYMRSIEPLEAAYQKDTASVEVCLLLGSALGKTYDRTRAYRLLDKAGEGMQPDPFLLNQLTLFRAETFQRDARLQEAIALYYQLWKANPSRIDPLWQIASMTFRPNQSGYENDNLRERGLFAQVLYVAEFLKSGGGDAAQLSFIRKLLESFYEDAFFRTVTELPMTAPDGKKSKISVIDLRGLINRIPGEPGGVRQNSL
ncbi:MAG: tetratricopeptide repeat protein [Tannerellaceae bacterium]|jgi:tetratricopeptide (TPR) repeat protein|nr:tetratricopeptide repeat protein [Tannerellaceae bacterium]